MAIKLEVGQWYRNRNGSICHCTAKSLLRSDDPWYVESKEDGSNFFYADGRLLEAEQDDMDLIEHLPDCIGFDWESPQTKRPEPPAGWRWLGDDEELDTNDHFWNKKNPRTPDYAYGAGKTWLEMKVDGYDSLAWGIIRKIPTYRPFANAAEFAPHRDRWIKRTYNKSCDDKAGCYKAAAYDDSGIWIMEGDKISYDQMFAEGRLFDDGTPFGVLES